MIWFKGCPRCSGDLFHDRDQYGQLVTCVQCGFSKDLTQKSSEPIRFVTEPVPVPTVPQWEGGGRWKTPPIVSWRPPLYSRREYFVRPGIRTYLLTSGLRPPSHTGVCLSDGGQRLIPFLSLDHTRNTGWTPAQRGPFSLPRRFIPVVIWCPAVEVWSRLAA